ncbi:MAG: DUF3617 family protein [Pseudomonadota bacterium]
MSAAVHILSACVGLGWGGLCIADTSVGYIALTPGQWESLSSIEVVEISNGEPETVFSPDVDVREQCVKPENTALLPINLAGPGCEVISSTNNGTELQVELTCRRTDGDYQGWLRADAGETGLSAVAQLELTRIRADGSQRIVRAEMSSRRSGPCLE